MSALLLWTSCASTASTQTCDAAALRSVRTAHADRSEVTVCGTVVRVGRLRRSRSGTHRSFLVDTGPSDTIEIDANVDVMGDFPVHPGERAVVRGEYYSDPSGRDGVHWTHHTDRGRHQPGFVTLDGTTYR